MTLYTYQALVQRVIDADTIVLDCDLGFSVWIRSFRLRLAHINAPELSTEAGQAAKVYLEGLLPPPGVPLTLETLKDRTDNYGRYLGVLLTPSGVNINEALLVAGHAVPWPAVPGGREESDPCP